MILRAPASITPPPLSDWRGLIAVGFLATGLITATCKPDVSVDIPLLRPGTLHTLNLVMEAEPINPGEPVQVSFGEDARLLERGTQNQLILTSLAILPVQLRIQGACQLRILALELTCDQPSMSTPLPYDLIGLEVLAPTKQQGFKIGRSRIGQALLGGGSALSKGFIIGQSRLNEDRLPVELPELTWTDICGPALSLSIRRGASNTGLIPTAQAGILTVEIKNFDPRAHQLRHGLQVRCYTRLTRQLIFTGYITKMEYVPPKGEDFGICTLQASDIVGHLVNQKRYGAKSRPETLPQRIERYLSGTDYRYQIIDTPSAVDNRLGPTVLEASLASHLDAATASVGGGWWTRPDGEIIITPNCDVTPTRSLPWFIIGKTKLDKAILPPPGAQLPPDPDGGKPTLGFTTGQSRLDVDRISNTLGTIDSQFVIGSSRLDHAIVKAPEAKTAWAIARPPTPLLFTDTYADKEKDPWYYVDLTPSFNSAEELSQVTVSNHLATKPDGAGWQDNTVNHVATNPEAMRVYGPQSKSVTTTCSSATEADLLANYYLKRPVIADPDTLNINSAQVNALSAPTKAVITDLFDSVIVHFQGHESEHLVYAIEHRLTPYRWRTRYYLTQARARSSK